MKRPAFQFYPGDWLRDAHLRTCSLEARGLWIDMLALMHQAEPYGHLVFNGKAATPLTLSRMVGATPRDTARLVKELDDAGVFSRDEQGVIYSRRMVRDELLRNARAAGGVKGGQYGFMGKEFGKLGGNPLRKASYNEPGTLYAIQRASGGPIKVGITKNPSERFRVLRKTLGEDINVLGTFSVQDMGAVEFAVHESFGERCDGEWISAEWGEIQPAIEGACQRPLSPPLTPPYLTPPYHGEGEEAVALGLQDNPLPPWIDPQTWADYLAMRVRIRKPATERAQQLIVKELLRLKDEGHEANAVLEQSIRSSWQDVYALKDAKGGKGGVDAWWTSDEGIQRKGGELGMTPKPGETMASYRDRIKHRIDEAKRAA